jgi:hypothetical protein
MSGAVAGGSGRLGVLVGVGHGVCHRRGRELAVGIRATERGKIPQQVDRTRRGGR